MVERIKINFPYYKNYIASVPKFPQVLKSYAAGQYIYIMF